MKSMEQSLEVLHAISRPNTLHDIARILRDMVKHARKRSEAGEFTPEELGALMGAYHRIESQFGLIGITIPLHTALKPPVSPPEKPAEPLEGLGEGVEIPQKFKPKPVPAYWTPAHHCGKRWAIG